MEGDESPPRVKLLFLCPIGGRKSARAAVEAFISIGIRGVTLQPASGLLRAAPATAQLCALPGGARPRLKTRRPPRALRLPRIARVAPPRTGIVSGRGRRGRRA